MSSKRIFSWSKRQSSSEPYYRTGGLLPIDTNETESSYDFEAKIVAKAGRQRPSNLRIIPPDNKQLAFSPISAPYNAVLANAASNLQAAFNEILRSPAPSAAACTGTASLQKPLPSRPRSISAPSTPDLPAELPGSLLQDNQGFPSRSSPINAVPTRPISQTIRRGTHPPDKSFEDEGDSLNILNLVPEPLTHAKSVPNMSARNSTMRSVRSGNALNSSAAAKPSPLKVQHKKSLSETSSRRRSKPNLVTSPSSTDSKLTTYSVSTSGDSSTNSTKARSGAAKSLQPSPLIVEGKPWKSDAEEHGSLRNELGASATPTPTTTRNKHIEELKATITTQDQTISTLQAQFGSLRASHEAHVASLADTHLAEIASLKNYARVLEEQLARKPSLHHASSNNLLFLLDTTEPPQTPSRESSQHTAGSGSASSITSFQSALEKQQRSPQRVRNSPEMENLRRKLSTTKRPETTNRNLLPELNQYKQNNVALQKQIESLMAKLNESKKNEREARTTLEGAERKCVEWQEKAGKADKLAKGVQALQNTIDHLENRLEIANIERLDAEEQLFNLQIQKSPFDVALPKLQVPSTEHPKETKDARMSMSTVFSSGSPISQENETQELSTLAAFIAHIERLQDQVRQKDAYITELEADLGQLRTRHSQLQQEHNETALRLDIQSELLRKTRHTDSHIEQLRTAIIDREAIIGEKEKSIRAVERQLEHHKLLLQAEIRRHAAMKLHVSVEDDPLPELTSLAAKGDIDKWIDKLHQRLKREQQTSDEGRSIGSTDAQVASLRQEIDFYIREIIYYKLDIKGYKSDIRKLKRATAQLSSYGDLESDTSSLRPATTPSRPRFTSATPELGASGTTSPTLMGLASAIAVNRPVTPPPSGSTHIAGFSPIDRPKPTNKPAALDLRAPMTPQTPTSRSGHNSANEADNIDPGISPRSVSRLSPERRKPTPPSPDRERFGDLLTNFPLSTPAAPQRHDTQRSMSESIIQLYTAPRTPERSITVQENATPASNRNAVVFRGRSASASDASKNKIMPERPPRPQYGLFDSSAAVDTDPSQISSPLQVDVLAEALRHSPVQDTAIVRPLMQRNDSNSSSVRMAPASIAKDFRDRSASSPSPFSPTVQRSRAGSTGSTTGNFPNQSASTPERKLSVASSSSIPFVIAMGSPHNPALITPTTSMPPTACSITRNAPLTINSSISRAGVGGTMASSTPVTSPISTTGAPRLEPPPKPSSTIPVASTSAVQVRRPSLSKKQEDQNPRPLRTPPHSRNVSGSSIRTAIRLPKTRDKEKEEAHKMRKDSISMPRPLDSPFGVERSTSADLDHSGRGDNDGVSGYAFGIGEAI
ncbi:Nn.00g051270.m01.CDS01 [Neocucurbitaria sp. VM-36]